MDKRQKVIGFLYVLPALIGFLSFVIIPFIITIQTGFKDSGNKSIGFANYISLFESAAFRLALVNTVKFILIGVPAIILYSFIIALMLKKFGNRSKLFRTFFVLPMVVPVGSVIMVFNVVFERSGMINTILAKFSHENIDFFGSKNAFWILLLLYLWKNSGWNIVIFLSALSKILPEYYEAADLDGATNFRKLISITIPFMKQSFFFISIISVVNVFKSFREAFALGGNHPHDSIYMLQHFMNNNFENLNYPRLSAASVIAFSFIFVIVFIFYRISLKSGEIQL